MVHLDCFEFWLPYAMPLYSYFKEKNYRMEAATTTSNNQNTTSYYIYNTSFSIIIVQNEICHLPRTKYRRPLMIIWWQQRKKKRTDNGFFFYWVGLGFILFPINIPNSRWVSSKGTIFPTRSNCTESMLRVNRDTFRTFSTTTYQIRRVTVFVDLVGFFLSESNLFRMFARHLPTTSYCC